MSPNLIGDRHMFTTPDHSNVPAEVTDEQIALALAQSGRPFRRLGRAVAFDRPTTAYLAARVSRKRELAGYRDGDLARLGIRVPARWLDSHVLNSDGQPVNDAGDLIYPDNRQDASVWRRGFATDDFGDVIRADMLIAFTEEPRSTNSRGGRHVELGIALGAGKPIYLVGPRENVFCHLPAVRQFDTWPELVEHFESRLPTVVNL